MFKKNRKPIIGIVAKPYYHSGQPKEVTVDDWRMSIEKCGGVPISILPPQSTHDIAKKYNVENANVRSAPDLTLAEKRDLFQVLRLCDGIVLEGGMSCHRYEIDIAKWAIDHNVPLIGSCAGFNNIVWAAGGEVRWGTKDEIARHNRPYAEKYVHDVTVMKGSHLSKIVGVDAPRLCVNSRHWMMVEPAMVKDLNIVAVSDDGLVEAVELPRKKFVLGLKWHPESMIDYDPHQRKIIENFIDACK
ncbi:gamma-glutamyl-gamma-aminobutyrate hydrolase family protein [Candidatus Saccharibacteria bacterium]|nr:gamma-glutamyl-gamma-aminobutyrate hydrolase family protein [Candidatus Saccharibacteria bacterium]MCL1963273.1 gamma-glutamyl-gamma-aminobutyrate hydrolase family protein [Candidatus Saccharibacteria bacterium]